MTLDENLDFSISENSRLRALHLVPNKILDVITMQTKPTNIGLPKLPKIKSQRR